MSEHIHFSLGDVDEENVDNLLVEDLEIGTNLKSITRNVFESLEALAESLDKQAIVINSTDRQLEQHIPESYDLIEQYEEAGLITAEKELEDRDIEILDEDTASEVENILREVRNVCGIDSPVTTQCNRAIGELTSTAPRKETVESQIVAAESIAIYARRGENGPADLLNLAIQTLDVRTSTPDDRVNHEFSIDDRSLDNIPEEIRPPELAKS